MAGRLGANFQCMQMSEWLLKSFLIQGSSLLFPLWMPKGMMTYSQSVGFSKVLLLSCLLLPVQFCSVGMIEPQELHSENLPSSGDL